MKVLLFLSLLALGVLCRTAGRVKPTVTLIPPKTPKTTLDGKQGHLRPHRTLEEKDSKPQDSSPPTDETPELPKKDTESQAAKDPTEKSVDSGDKVAALENSGEPPKATPASAPVAEAQTTTPEPPAEPPRYFDPTDDQLPKSPEEENKMDKLGYVYFHPNECQILGVHLSPGKYWVNSTESMKDEDNENLYTVGFSSPAKCDESQLRLHLMVSNSVSLHLPATKVREYSAPAGSGVDYHRHFYFFQLTLKQVRASACSFNYTIIYKDYVTTQFNFTSSIYCRDDYKIVTFGQSDDGVAGIQTLDSLRYYPYDMVVLTGNYVSGYHLDDGRLADRYFSSAEHILATTVSVILPGRRESFDNYRMFLSRFLYPNCVDSVDCDLAYFRDTNIKMFFINIDKYLVYPELDMHGFVDQVAAVLEEPASREAEEGEVWRFVFTNTNFYCSDQSLYNNCVGNLFLVKEWEDLFELYGINLVVSSAKMNYESVRNVYNFAVRQTYDVPRNYIMAGIAGCHNYLAENGQPTLMKDLSFAIENSIQAVVSIDFFPTFYKMDLLDIPRFVSRDMRYMNISNSILDVLWFVLVILLIFGVIMAFEFTHASAIGRHWASERAKTISTDLLDDSQLMIDAEAKNKEKDGKPNEEPPKGDLRTNLLEEDSGDSEGSADLMDGPAA